MRRGLALLERIKLVLESGEFVGDLLPFVDDGGGLVTEVGHERRALFGKLDEVDERREDKAGAFRIGEVDVLCAKVHDARGICKAGKMIKEEVVCYAGDVDVLKGVRTSEKIAGARTVFGSSSAASAFCTGSWRASGAMEVTCSRQAVYTLVTKSAEGRASCSLLMERPHSERAVMISGMGMFGNQYCPDMVEGEARHGHVAANWTRLSVSSTCPRRARMADPKHPRKVCPYPPAPPPPHPAQRLPPSSSLPPQARVGPHRPAQRVRGPSSSRFHPHAFHSST